MSNGTEQTTPSVKETAIDLGILTAVAFFLAGIHFLVPASIRTSLAFTYGAFEPWVLFTAAYVHASNAHLLGNVLGYAIAAVYAYSLAFHANSLHWFRRTTIALLILVPPVVTAANWAFFTYQNVNAGVLSRGFSGVVAAFGGALLVALYLFVRDRYDHDLAFGVIFAMFLLLMALIDFQFGGLTALVVILGLVGLIVAFGGYVRRHDVGLKQRVDQKRAALTGVVVLLVGVVLVVLFLGLFPSGELVSDGTLTNVFAHLVGFISGLLISSVVLILSRRQFLIRH